MNKEQIELIEIVQKLSRQATLKDIYSQEKLNSLIDITINLLSLIPSKGAK